MDMDMTRIESITILKDAAAKALYGSKAANGVIVIETKRLAGNQELVTYTGSIEVSMPDLTSYNLCNAWEKLEAERIEGVYTSANPPDAGGSHQTLQRTQSAGARRTGHLLARKTPAHGRRPQTHPLGRTGRQPQTAGR